MKNSGEADPGLINKRVRRCRYGGAERRRDHSEHGDKSGAPERRRDKSREDSAVPCVKYIDNLSSLDRYCPGADRHRVTSLPIGEHSKGEGLRLVDECGRRIATMMLFDRSRL
jgi:hypothetical protein